MIKTVTGDVDKKELGVTSAHEHLFIDMKNCVDEPEKDDGIFYRPFSAKLRGEVFCDPYAVWDNAFINEYDVAERELEAFKRFGGEAIVDCTLDEIGRDPENLITLSEKTGVKIVMGCGHYYQKAHFPCVQTATVEELAKKMITDITVGAKGTSVKAGVIGEIGTSAVMSADEKKVLHAAGIAGKETGKAIHVHTDLYTENGDEIIEILTSHGVKPEKICIDHIDVWLRPDYIRRLLDKGVYVEFDNFGKEFYLTKKRRFAYDLERIVLLSELIKEGYGEKVLVSNDICLKSMLVEYGGNGYAHILRTIKKMAEEHNIPAKAYEKILTENVANFLD